MIYLNGILPTLDTQEHKNMLGLILNYSPEHLLWNGRTLIIICQINFSLYVAEDKWHNTYSGNIGYLKFNAGLGS